jgi:hypothetical protein
VIVVALWAIRRLIVDASFAIRGRVPPTMTGRAAGGRYGLRGYFGDVWSDAWRNANDRRVARRDARAAGQLGRLGRLRRRVADARQSGRRWWRTAGGSRQLHRDRDGTVTDTVNPSPWEHAWERAEQARAARAARRTAGHGGGDGPPPPRPRPDSDPDSDPASPAGDAPSSPSDGNHALPDAGNHARPPTAADTSRPGASTDPDPAPGDPTPGTGSDTPPPQPTGDGSGPTNPTTPRQPPRPDDHTNTNREGNPMAEATGLDSAISYADAQRQAHEENVTDIESWIASLQANEVSGEALDAARRAEEQQQLAAASWQQAHAALESHRQVQEAYAATGNQAGSKQFVTTE